MPATQQASSSSPVPPLAPAAPMIVPSLSLISAAPVCGRNLPPAVAASVMKKLGLSLARLKSALLEAPIATDAHALPFAMSRRNMLAPSSRCADLMLPESSSTTTPSGLIFISRALARAFAMMVLACCNVSLDMRSSVVGWREYGDKKRRDYTSGPEPLSIDRRETLYEPSKGGSGHDENRVVADCRARLHQRVCGGPAGLSVAAGAHDPSARTGQHHRSTGPYRLHPHRRPARKAARRRQPAGSWRHARNGNRLPRRARRLHTGLGRRLHAGDHAAYLPQAGLRSAARFRAGGIFRAVPDRDLRERQFSGKDSAGFCRAGEGE